MPSSVLPDPGPPATSVGRPAGKPPKVISSSPGMPVGAFAISFLPLVFFDMPRCHVMMGGSARTTGGAY